MNQVILAFVRPFSASCPLKGHPTSRKPAVFTCLFVQVCMTLEKNLHDFYTAWTKQSTIAVCPKIIHMSVCF